MDQLIKRKNLRARKGKQRWRRNIDVSELQHLQSQSLLVDGFPMNNKNQQLSFTMDAEKNKQNIYENRDRFKKRPQNEKLVSKNEKKKIAKFMKIQKLNDNNNNINNNNFSGSTIQGKHQQQLDIWSDGEQACDTRKLGDDEQLLQRPKFLIKPSQGQSYNPQIEHYQELMDAIIQKELDQKRQNVSNMNTQEQSKKLIDQELRRKEKARLSRIHSEQGKQLIDQIDEKRINHQFTLLKKYKKEFKERDNEMQLRLEKEQQDKIAQQEAFKEGKLYKPLKIGKKFIKNQDEDIILEDELPEKLRNLQTGDRLVHNQFQSIFRRGLLEPKGPSNKLTKSKLPKYKIKERNDGEDEPFLSQKLRR